ncbi:hypothetical protein BO86DRAFT_319918 [Aspergillus japonicus CBS 114.51]|uniref:Apple domain-containing protein n=1 Tax=Aspergillus japonicus CBS 114.51 TaxID=1448312 RepID=A0A8T8WSM0_ASPJA|nr:hypothetical protein BO86DRAFT_319918 [Aspergillus japonicus CBS 114.51]RAH78817.1 hypothetical protein BO86DRAFT_319918 [Aspergillus japonicus CBS 114.51]
MLLSHSTFLGVFALTATTIASTACLDNPVHDTIAFFSGTALTFGSNYTNAADCGHKCSILPACQTWLFTSGGQCELFRHSPVATAPNPNFTYGLCGQGSSPSPSVRPPLMPSSSYLIHQTAASSHTPNMVGLYIIHDCLRWQAMLELKFLNLSPVISAFLPLCDTSNDQTERPLQFDNTGSCPLRVPGFREIPLDYEFDINQRFAHGAREHYSRRAIRLTAPEVQMLRLMERITDIPNWEHDVFDEQSLAQWRAQASSSYASLDSNSDQDVDMDLITTRAWLWCVAELQDKAKGFRDTGHVIVLNADSGVGKRDDQALRDELQEALRPLLTTTKGSGAHDLVDPSLHMLVYGRTTVLSDGGWVPPPATDGSVSQLYCPSTDPRQATAPVQDPSRSRTALIPRELFYLQDNRKLQQVSFRFQWLPCEVEFAEPSGTAVRITSYINNLHPSHTQAYSAIEKLISYAIGSWNKVLVKGTGGRMPRRIYTYGVTDREEECLMDVEPPEDILPVVWNQEITRRAWSPEQWESYCTKVREYLILPDVDPKYRVFAPEPGDPPETEDLLAWMTPEMWASPAHVEEIIRAKFRRLHRFSYPEPGISYTYEDWKRGQTANPIFGPWLWDHKFDSPRNHDYYSVSLEDQFRKQGLQVIVQVFSIDLTPEDCGDDGAHVYPGDPEFHVDGMLNEHIVATAHFCYSAENITESRISYQQRDCLHISGHQPDPFCIYKLYGIPPSPGPGEDPNALPLQTLGSVAVTQGRFLMWPNALRYKRLPFSLLDPSRPGHQRCVVLWLVDPHYRICSTRNVPPQQHDWWRNAVLAKVSTTPLSTLPPELMDMVMEETGPWPMHLAEALQYKKESEKEREEAVPHQLSHIQTYGFWWELS